MPYASQICPRQERQIRRTSACPDGSGAQAFRGRRPRGSRHAADLGRLLLGHGRFAEAAAALQDIRYPSAQNNLGLALFAQGDVGAARARFEANWQGEPRNLYALCHVARLRLWQDPVSAAGLREAFLAGVPARTEDGWGLMSGLLLLRAYAEAMDAWQAMRGAAFWSGADPLMHGQCAQFAAAAAQRMGRPDLASEYLSEAADIDQDNDVAVFQETGFLLPETAREELGGQPDYWAGDFADWFPAAWENHLPPDMAWEALPKELCRSCDAHAGYLGLAVELGDGDARGFALSVLKQRSAAGDSEAVEALRGLLVRPGGPDRVRLELSTWLQYKGFLGSDEAYMLLLDGRLCERRGRSARLHAHSRDTGLPAASQARLERVHHMLRRGNLKEALRIARELETAHPDHPLLIGMVASVREGLGAPTRSWSPFMRAPMPATLPTCSRKPGWPGLRPAGETCSAPKNCSSPCMAARSTTTANGARSLWWSTRWR